VHEGSIAFHDIILKLERYEQFCDSKGGFLRDEQVWVYLLTNVYCFNGENHLAVLYKVLADNPPPEDCQFWIEALPEPPRLKEGSSHIDIACGAICGREDTIGGIQYAPRGQRDDPVCFVEAKFLSDISVHTTHDPERNQLSRVIESALKMRSSVGSQPNKVVVSLLTPARFKKVSEPINRMYAYKFRSYQEKDNLSAELVSDAKKRLNSLTLRWVTFEELINATPQNQLKDSLLEFLKTERMRGGIL
jgi:hypothetical protein